MACGPRTWARAGHGRTRARVRLGNDSRWGMTGGPHLSASAGEGERRGRAGWRWCWANWAGSLLGRVLGGLASAAGGGRGVGPRWLGHGRGLLLLLLGWLAR
jgi:hypothetical protein